MLSALLASTAFAHAGTERTFYLVDASDGVSDETPGDRPDGPTDGLTFETVNGAPFVARTPLLTSPLAIALSDSFHLHLADREAFVNDTYTTVVWIGVRDATDRSIQTEDNKTWFLATTLVRARSDASDGWSDIRLAVNPTLPTDAIARGFTTTAHAIIIPPGYRLTLYVWLASGSEHSGPGAAFREGAQSAAELTEESGILPGRGDITCPTLPVRCSFLEQVDVEGTLVGVLRDPATLRNLDNLMSGISPIPASHFRADDAGSWLRVTTAD